MGLSQECTELFSGNKAITIGISLPQHAPCLHPTHHNSQQKDLLILLLDRYNFGVVLFWSTINKSQALLANCLSPDLLTTKPTTNSCCKRADTSQLRSTCSFDIMQCAAAMHCQMFALLSAAWNSHSESAVQMGYNLGTISFKLVTAAFASRCV